MSNTFDIHCDTCKKTYWFGQTIRNENSNILIYSPDKLGNFLFEHRGHILSVTDEYLTDLESGLESIIKRKDYEKDWDS